MTEILSFDHQSSLPLEVLKSLQSHISLGKASHYHFHEKETCGYWRIFKSTFRNWPDQRTHTKKVALFMQRRLTIPTKPHKTCKEVTEAYTNLHSTLSTKMIKISLKHTFFVSYSWDFLIHWHFSLFFKQKSKDKEESLGTPPSMLLLARPNPLVQRRSTQHCPKHKKLCMLASSYWKKPKFYID